MNLQTLEKILDETLGPRGRMISSSKSGYRERNPDNLTVFNSNLVLLEAGEKFGLGSKHGKVWFGDIDITKNHQSLKDLADRTNCEVVILAEMDGRFENESDPLINKFIYKVAPNGAEKLGEYQNKYFNLIDLKHT